MWLLNPEEREEEGEWRKQERVELMGLLNPEEREEEGEWRKQERVELMGLLNPEEREEEGWGNATTKPWGTRRGGLR